VSAKYKNKQKYKLQKINYRKQNRDDATVASIGLQINENHFKGKKLCQEFLSSFM